MWLGISNKKMAIDHSSLVNTPLKKKSNSWFPFLDIYSLRCNFINFPLQNCFNARLAKIMWDINFL